MTRIDYFQLIKLMDLELADELAGEDEYPYYDGELGIKYSREKAVSESGPLWPGLLRSFYLRRTGKTLRGREARTLLDKRNAKGYKGYLVY